MGLSEYTSLPHTLDPYKSTDKPTDSCSSCVSPSTTWHLFNLVRAGWSSLMVWLSSPLLFVPLYIMQFAVNGSCNARCFQNDGIRFIGLTASLSEASVWSSVYALDVCFDSKAPSEGTKPEHSLGRKRKYRMYHHDHTWNVLLAFGKGHFMRREPKWGSNMEIILPPASILHPKCDLGYQIVSSSFIPKQNKKLVETWCWPIEDRI